MKKNRPRCLVITPFDTAGQRVRDTVRRTLEAEGIEVVRLEDLALGSALVSSITDAISSADFLVADITRQNPNVMYEIGLAHGMRKPTVLIQSTEAQSAFPSDLSGWLYVTYDPANFKGFSQYLSRAVAKFKQQTET